MIFKSLIFVLTCLSFTFCNAQSSYLILLNGDSLVGTVHMPFNDEKVDHVQIKTSENKKDFSALKIRKVLFNGVEYHPVKYNDSYKLMKVISQGYLTLYSFRPTGTYSWDGNYLQKKDGSGIEVPNIGFKKNMSKFLVDCPEVYTQIETGDLGRKDIESIVTQYNLCIETRSKQRFEAAKDIVLSNEKSDAVKRLLLKIEREDFDSKKDVISILNDIQSKINKNENVPNYLLEALKSNLNSAGSFSKDAEELISILKK